MDLKDFIRRSAGKRFRHLQLSLSNCTDVVLKLYRHLLQSATKLKDVDAGLSRSSVEQIKTQFRINQSESSKVTIAVMIQEGQQQLDLLKELYKSKTRATARAEPNSSEWKGSVNSDGEDERGRVGRGFPWE